MQDLRYFTPRPSESLCKLELSVILYEVCGQMFSHSIQVVVKFKHCLQAWVLDLVPECNHIINSSKTLPTQEWQSMNSIRRTHQWRDLGNVWRLEEVAES